jgi:TolA-binding protein
MFPIGVPRSLACDSTQPRRVPRRVVLFFISDVRETLMPFRHAPRLETVIMGALVGLSLSIAPVLAAGDPEPPPAAAAPAPAHPPPAANSKSSPGMSSQKGKKKKNDQQSQQEYQEYIDGYKAARALVLDGKYEDAIQAFRALGHDESAEVANYVGYAYRKLGDYDLSKTWYDRALAADPDHVRTWEYYGLWHLEQGNKLKAQDFLEKVHALCGNTTCQEYIDLKAAIEDGRNSY